MQTTVNKLNDVDYEFEVNVPAAELAPEIDKSLRQQRARTQLKGFRPGKVPLSLVRKLVGDAVGFSIAEKALLDAYKDEILDSKEHDVLGQPNIMKLDYQLDGDLHAIIRFGVKPDFELADLSKIKIMRLKHDIEEKDIDKEIHRIQLKEAELTLKEKGKIAKEDQVTVSMQKLDHESGSPIVGEREEGVVFFMDDDQLQDALKKGLKGKKAGDSFRVDIPSEEEGEEATPYEVTIGEVKSRKLPELNTEFVKKVTGDKAENEAGLRDEIRTSMVEVWKRQSDELMEGEMVVSLLDAHDFTLPESAVESYLMGFLEDLKQRNNGELPENFPMEQFREANRHEAQRQARWAIIRDRIIDEQEIEVTEEDIDAHYVEMANGDEEMAKSFRGYYEAMNMTDQLRPQLLSKKVFGYLADQFKVEEKGSDAYKKAIEKRNKAAEKKAEAEAKAAEKKAEAEAKAAEKKAKAAEKKAKAEEKAEE